MTHLALCMPCYEGKVSLHWMSAYMRTRDLLTRENIKFDLLTVGGCGLIHLAREELMSQALRTGATDVLFVDARQLWEPIGVLRLLEDLERASIVAAPTASRDGAFFANWNGIERGHLKGVTHCSMAFMGMRRDTLQAILEAYPELDYDTETGKHTGVCHPMIENGKSVGEDIAFTLRAIRCGNEIWVDEGITVKRLI